MAESDDELLARVIAGDLHPESPTFRAALGRNPELGKRLAQLVALLSALERTGLDERQSIARAKLDVSERDLEIVRDRIRRVRRGRPWWRRSVLLYLSAAAIVACIGWFAWRGDPSRTSAPPTVLGNEQCRAIEPTLERGDASSFRWEGELPPTGHFVVRIFASDATGAPTTMVLESARCSERTWRPGESDLGRIPDEFVWEVEARYADGQHFALSELQRALRSRR
jgi:hypothetical protein